MMTINSWEGPALIQSMPRMPTPQQLGCTHYLLRHLLWQAVCPRVWMLVLMLIGVYLFLPVKPAHCYSQAMSLFIVTLAKLASIATATGARTRLRA